MLLVFFWYRDHVILQKLNIRVRQKRERISRSQITDFIFVDQIFFFLLFADNVHHFFVFRFIKFANLLIYLST